MCFIEIYVYEQYELYVCTNRTRRIHSGQIDSQAAHMHTNTQKIYYSWALLLNKQTISERTVKYAVCHSVSSVESLAANRLYMYSAARHASLMPV